MSSYGPPPSPQRPTKPALRGNPQQRDSQPQPGFLPGNNPAGAGLRAGMMPGLAGSALGSGGAGAGIGQTPSKRNLTVREMRELMHKEEHSEIVKRYTALSPRLKEDPELLYLYAWALECLAKYGTAIEPAERSLAKFEHIAPIMLLARCHRMRGETEKVMSWCDRAEKLAPNEEGISFIRGGALEDAGRFDESTAVLQPIVDKYAASGKPLPLALRLEWPKLLVQAKKYEEAIELIDDSLALEGTPPAFRSMLLHLKAKAADRKKDYDVAFEAAARANEIGRIEFDPELYKEQVTVLTENWSRESMTDFPTSACDSLVPIFVAGMPRSGTSLIDQIIDAHPKASGVGELNSIEVFAGKLASAWDPDRGRGKEFGSMDSRRWTKAAEAYVKEITALAEPGTERVVNKALGNNKLVGLIARLFPKTRIIHAIRDPRDVAISCFMGGFNNRLHPWTTRIEWASEAWAQSRRMMDHWKASIDVPVLEVNYERLVADPDNEFPRIIEFLGLEWDDRCFEFHKSRRTVRTLSYDQVNRPLYTSSSGRHANYAKHIEGVEFPEYDPWARED